jgi:hypothetical protein
MPDVSSTAPTDLRLWVARDVHKHSIVAATLPPAGGTPGQQRHLAAVLRRAGERRR